MKKLLYLGVLLAIAGAIVWPGGSSTPQSSDPVLIGAGDIADGFNLNLASSMATAALLDANPGATVFAAGDLAYDNGSDGDFAKSYDPTWGRARARTIPVIGNHEYNTLNAAGFFSYFGPAAGDPTKGYYSLNVGAWHIVVINSNCSKVGGCNVGSPQDAWLRNDLASHTQICTLALWHAPYYTSVASGQGVTADAEMQPIWQDLYNASADLVVNGHAHNYERFAPQDANGNLDTAKGLVEIIAGTGGESHMTFGKALSANSVAQNSTAYGVLKLTLHASSYDWQFIPQAGQTFNDSGTQTCH
jgi:hypothetical protein